MPFKLPRWFAQTQDHRHAEQLYAAASSQSRSVALFSVLGVPDTLDGRFDALCLHVVLLLRRLGRDDTPACAALIQGVYDAMFADMDRTLRELGVGDLGVGKRVRQMAEGLMGRARAYGEALDAEDDQLLTRALGRNLFGTVAAPLEGDVQRLGAYVRASDMTLKSQEVSSMIEHGPRFAKLPEDAGNG